MDVLAPGAVVADRYRVERFLGRGGYAEVYAATHLQSEIQFALKVLRDGAPVPEPMRQVQVREAHNLIALGVEEAVWFHELVDGGDRGPILVLELLEGETLLDRLKRDGPMDMSALHPIATQLFCALAAIHRRGFVHTALKPSDVFLQRTPSGKERVRILDFQQACGSGAVDDPLELDRSLGAFSFLSPERIGRASLVDARTDIYSVGTLLFQTLSGQLPYAARNILQMVDMKRATDARALSEVVPWEVAPALESFLRRSLARAPADRFQTAEEAADAWEPLASA